MKKFRLVVAGLLLFSLGGLAFHLSPTFFVIVLLSFLGAYELIRIEYEQYQREQIALANKLAEEELEYEEQLKLYRKRKYTTQWLENIW